jgi:ubiquinone biosynthesis protein
MLIDLFATARRFNMEVQPSLVLLQKTLLNIEGLGRQLYPDLDLWQTAQPFLEQWMKDRYSPKSIFKQLKRYAPDWLEHFPQIPPMIFQALKSAHQSNTNDIVKQSTSMPQQTTVWSKPLSALGFGSLGGGIAIGISQWSAALGQPPLVSLGLVFVGLVILVLRKP